MDELLLQNAIQKRAPRILPSTAIGSLQSWADLRVRKDTWFCATAWGNVTDPISQLLLAAVPVRVCRHRLLILCSSGEGNIRVERLAYWFFLVVVQRRIMQSVEIAHFLHLYPYSSRKSYDSLELEVHVSLVSSTRIRALVNESIVYWPARTMKDISQ